VFVYSGHAKGDFKMTRQNKLMALIAGGALALSGSAFAQSSAPAAKSVPAAAISSTKGVVKSIDANQIVIDRKVRSGPKELTLVMNSDTQKEGDVKVGAEVTVHYRYDNRQDLATAIKVDK
jgi:hypothetical protein